MEGYKNNSPDRFNSYNVIPSNRITMQGVNHPVYGISNTGDNRLMYPGEEHQFNGQQVIEYPIKSNTMAKKQSGYTVPNFQYKKLGGAAIIPDNNPYGTNTAFVPVQYQRAQNGMMQFGGGYLDFISQPEITNPNMQHGGPTTNYAPTNMDNSSVQFVQDKRDRNNMQNPGHHWTNDGWKKTTGSTMNGASWSKFGGPGPANGLPAPLEYAYLENGGAYSQMGGTYMGTEDGIPVDEMKNGGIHIKKSHEGRFTAYKKRTGKTTEEALHSPDPAVRKMANFARNAAKWHHKEFGGDVLDPNHPLSKFIKMYQDGGATELDGPSASTQFSAATAIPPTDVNTQYNSQLAAGNPDPYANQRAQKYDNNITSVSPDSPIGPGANPDYNAADETANYNKFDANGAPQGQGMNVGDKSIYNPQQSRQAVGQAGQNLLGAGLMAASYFEDRAKQRQMQGFNRQQGMTDNAFGAQRLNTAGNKGDYNQAGTFRPNQNTPVMPGMMYPQAEYGGGMMGGFQTGGSYSQHGGYTDGQIVELPEEHIAQLRKQGYKIEYI